MDLMLSDHPDHVSEGGQHEDELRHELPPDGEFIVEIEEIEEGEYDSEEHVADSEDDRHFHLERVCECEFVRLVEPCRVDSARVGPAGGVVEAEAVGVARVRLPRRAVHVQRDGQAVVVDDAAVDGEGAHHHEHVATAERHGGNLAQCAGLLLGQNLVLVVDHRGGREEQKHSVA